MKKLCAVLLLAFTGLFTACDQFFAVRGAVHSQHYDPPPTPVPPYRSVFSNVKAFPQQPGCRLRWRQISKSKSGPWVQLIFHSTASLADIDNFYGRSLTTVGCTKKAATDQRPGGFTQWWQCVPGYENDTYVIVNEAQAQGTEASGYYISVAFYLAHETPGIYTTTEPARTGSVVIMPIMGPGMVK